MKLEKKEEGRTGIGAAVKGGAINSYFELKTTAQPVGS